MDRFLRSKMLIGETALEKLKNSSVAVFGIGGVGGFCVEALARSGVGSIALFDNDAVSTSNINRQVVALESTVGRLKTEVMRDRILEINPNCKVTVYNVFYLPENADLYPLDNYHLVIDAVDTVTAKLEIIERSKKAGVEVISCMGTGGKLYPEKLVVSEVEKTSVCPLARVMRRELKKRNITGVKVVYSTEESSLTVDEISTVEQRITGRPVPPSMIFVPATAGLILAREGINYLIERK